ncbi:MAG: nucleotide-binding protein [Candidatus Woesearchaeota archaeon]
MEKVLLDTNFCMIPGQFKVDIFSEIRRILPTAKVCTLDLNIEELKRLEKEGSLKERRAARIALQLIKQKDVCIIKTKSFLNTSQNPKDADEALAEFAAQGYIIATQDRELKRRIKGPIIVMRKKKFLILITRG